MLSSFTADEEPEFKLTERQKEEVSETFDLFKKADSGKASTQDVNKMFQILGIHLTDEQQEDVVDDIDEDGTGNFSLELLMPVYTRERKRFEDEKELREAFRVLDKNNRGVIDVEDLRWILKSLGDDLTEDEIEDMINETDTDGSGTVDYEEFYNLMMGSN